MRPLPLLPLFFSSVFAQDGTCTAGQDPIGVEQSCLGRCHIYYEGDYGACNSYQVSAKDANGPCGDSIKNPCISTFNAGWDPSLTNCGNCYYVEMAYEDGTVRSTYLKTIDTNGSETKFEMSQVAWTNLCPYLCAGTGTCGNTPEACPYGTQQTSGMPAPCYVQNAPLTFKRIPCDESADDNDERTEAYEPTLEKHTSIRGTLSTRATSDSKSTTETLTKVVLTTTEAKIEIQTEASPSSGKNDHNVTNENENDEVNDANGSVIGDCEKSVHSNNPSWNAECKSLCTYYATQPIHCPNLASAEGLTACVKTLHPYCA